MKLLKSKSDETKVIVLATSEDDIEVLKTLWDNKVIFGAYTLIEVGKNTDTSYNKIIEKYPDTKLIMRINLVAGFADGVR
jgi:hypothetical protein